MKRVIAKLLVFVLLMTVGIVPVANGPKSAAKGKAPTPNHKGKVDFYCGNDDYVQVEKGKTMTVTFSNVKKSNVKSLRVFSYDQDVASVKVLSGKKVGYQVKVKKIGCSEITVSLTLKKAQAGKKQWGENYYVDGVRKLKKKELEEVTAKFVKNCTRSAIFDKYKTLYTYNKYFDEKGNDIGDLITAQTKDDSYFRVRNKEENGEFSDFHVYYKDGLGYWSGEKDRKPGYWFDISDSYKPFIINLVSDDPERQKEALDISGVTAYTNGDYVFATSKDKDNEGNYIRTDEIYYADTGIPDGIVMIHKDKDGKEYKSAIFSVELDLEMPAIYGMMKREFEKKALQTVKISFVYDPGTSDEKVLTHDIPKGSCFYFTPAPEGYKMYEDPKGETPIVQSTLDSNPNEEYEDVTLYLIKDTATAQ